MEKDLDCLKLGKFFCPQKPVPDPIRCKPQAGLSIALVSDAGTPTPVR